MMSPPALTRLSSPPGREHVVLGRINHSVLPNPEELWPEYFSDVELDDWQACRHPGRKSEWLGVRICLKSLVCETGRVADPRHVAVKKNERGRPQLIQRSDGLPVPGDCSLSHAQAWGVAAWTDRPEERVGVDVERISTRLNRAKGAFVSADDQAAARRPELEQLTVWWCLKEAFSKAVGLGLGAGLAEIACREITPGQHRLTHDSGLEMAGWHTVFDDYVIALCGYRTDL